uniref:WD_REPEATS_REGION domain-containing protein n=1 Tax=Angiostrongylus cantonensis TaxID=6313 RepID=A0A0K0CSV2_ANGCA
MLWSVGDNGRCGYAAGRVCKGYGSSVDLKPSVELRLLSKMDTSGPTSQMGSTLMLSGAGTHLGTTQGCLDDLSDKQLTPEILQILVAFLRKNGLSVGFSCFPLHLFFIKETEEALAKEANNLLVMGEDVTASSSLPSSETLLSEFESFVQFVDSSYDFFQAEFSLLLFPIFAHSYVKLLVDSSVTNGRTREFFKRYCKRIPAPYEELVYKIERLQTAQQVQADSYVQLLMKNGFLVKMSKSSIKQLEIPLARTPMIKNIVKEHITLEASDVISKHRSSIDSQMGGILGQVSKNEKRHKMYYGVLKDDVSQTIEKRKTRGKEPKDSKKSQAVAPVPDRIPLPPLSEALREERRKAMRDASKLTLVSQESPPSVCMLTALNAYGGVSCCDLSDDTTILSMGSSDGSIELTSLNEEQKLKKLRDMDALERVSVSGFYLVNIMEVKWCIFFQIDMEADNLPELIYDDVNAKPDVNLHGHSGSVYSVHFSPDNRLLVSSSLDSTIRLWSVETHKNVVVYRLSRPVWQVQFSNRGYYMCSGGEDNVAALWCTERMHPLRIFADSYGSVNCVDFHPNCNYIVGGSEDRYVRVWDALTGTCVRTFCGHSAGVTAVKVSPCGRYIVSTAGDGVVCVWDVAHQRLSGMETREFRGAMVCFATVIFHLVIHGLVLAMVFQGSICFSRDGGSFAVSQGDESLSVYSLDNLIAATSNLPHYLRDVLFSIEVPFLLNFLPLHSRINMPNFNIFTYPTMQTSVIGLHFTRRNLLLAVGMRMGFPEGLTSPEMEIAEGGVILDNRTRFADLKSMLDSSKDSLKDVSELFPAVVKNVAAKNIELKKLVFVYLVRYAEEQQDLALLSISTFQRALKDPNQLIRASALRVLSSIRVGMIAPIMLLAIKDSVRDMSPYVRKVAAHAIPKLYSLDCDLEFELVDCIDFLLADRRSLVLGSAVYAFEEICPNRMDLLHKHFRALCRALADVDEWGQVMMINLLTRYARSELANPELTPQPDVDLTLLLNSARPLLQSRNCSVVMAVTQLFYYTAPKSQLSQVARALVRLLRGPREVQYVVLLNIATISECNPVLPGTYAISKNIFDPFLKSFFVRSSDPSFVKELKLHILTSLVSETNVHIILRELQTYVSTGDFGGSAIEAIGRCAVRVKAVSEQCLAGLVQLITSPSESVVCSAVVVLKRLLHADASISLLSRLTRLIQSIQAPPARACIVWLIATHVEKVPNLAPDLLRILAKNFINEDEIVKVETLKLAVKLWMIRRQESEKLVHYVLQLARFDLSYDIRDRCRFLRNLLFNTEVLSQHAEQIFMAKKPSPTFQSSFKEREQFQLGTLSHALNQRCSRYQDLPSFPQVSSDASLRREANSPEEFKYENSDEVEEEEDEYEDAYGEEEEDSLDDEEEEEEEGGSSEEGDDEESSTYEILNTIEGDGIELSLSFPRTNDAQYTPLKFLLRNTTEVAIEAVELSPPHGFDVKKDFETVDFPAGASHSLCVSVDLGDSARRVEWILSRKTNKLGRNVSIEPIRLTEEEVEKERRRMSGLNRHSAVLSASVSEDVVLTVINAYRMPNGVSSIGALHVFL